MKILFVASGNSKNFYIAPFIKSQGESLSNEGIEIEYFSIKGKGIGGYLKNIPILSNYLHKNSVDIIHAHYGLVALLCLLTFRKIPIVASFMGDDSYGSYDDKGRFEWKSLYLVLITFIIQPFLDHIIVKATNIERRVFLKKKLSKIPNGVNIEAFRPLNKEFLKKQEGLNPSYRYVLFLGNPEDPRKNFRLANEAVELLKDKNVKLLSPFPISNDNVVKYLNIADVLLFSSTMEGSPNLIKEAMACNCPIVSTNVGDVEWVIGGTEGCYIAKFDLNDFSIKLRIALDFAVFKGRTKGRDRILELGLDSKNIALSLISVYKKVLKSPI